MGEEDPTVERKELRVMRTQLRCTLTSVRSTATSIRCTLDLRTVHRTEGKVLRKE